MGSLRCAEHSVIRRPPQGARIRSWHEKAASRSARPPVQRKRANPPASPFTPQEHVGSSSTHAAALSVAQARSLGPERRVVIAHYPAHRRRGQIARRVRAWRQGCLGRAPDRFCREGTATSSRPGSAASGRAAALRCVAAPDMAGADASGVPPRAGRPFRRRSRKPCLLPWMASAGAPRCSRPSASARATRRRQLPAAVSATRPRSLPPTHDARRARDTVNPLQKLCVNPPKRLASVLQPLNSIRNER
jgi:hypothetical protein